MSLIEKFIGTWGLEDFYMYTQKGERFYPFGAQAKGIIMYDSNGYMSVIITRDNRTTGLVQTNLLNEISEEDQQFLKTNAFFYTGTFNLKEKQKIVIHNVQLTSLPNAKKTQFIRYYEFKEDKLILSTPVVQVGNIEKKPIFLVWKRFL
ncbi:lipocalin-like domain-containing protein [Bacillus anthracis]|uniref:lipocalin-like domain-containing protein n=1 Tax=Bacillus anthracis TaxID=1392 RepID=UPI00099DF283|nr:lipocalin-like domain-containing protein [Bacillus anthracis]OPD54061.1 hypothetical protein BVG01_29360 [Bacillus anthracis]